MIGMVGERQFHNQPEHWAALAAMLRTADLSARVISDDLGDLTPSRLSQFDVVVNYSTDGDPTDEQIDALIGAVEGGLGFVGLHGASAGFRQSEPYHQLIGSRFVRHPPIRPYTVEVAKPDHPITRGIPNFTVEDELYEIRTVVDDLEILASAEGHPMVYVRQYGKGRICYIAPGHDQRALRHPTYIQLVHQAIGWAARR
jgi:type 1 glutamine amidotransferase